VGIGKLQISFYGPFVCLLDRDPIQVYAPRCIGHYASISTTEDEAPLEADPYCGMHKVFMISKSGIRANVSSITPVNPATHLRPPQDYKLSQDPRCAWFCLQLPRPTHAVGMLADTVGITGTNAPSGTNWATGLRLFFDYDMSFPEFQVTDGRAPILDTTLVDYGVGHQSEPIRFDITVRNVGPFLFDPNHDDAFSCFEASRNLIVCNGAQLDWDLNYEIADDDNDKRRPHVLGKVGGDCGAPLFIAI
jgi:hypothetical protein